MVIVLEIVSQTIKKIPPINADSGRRNLWSGPTIRREAWGIIKPTHPIIPATETDRDVMNVAMVIRMIFSLSVFIPNALASSSPIDIIFNFHA